MQRLACKHFFERHRLRCSSNWSRTGCKVLVYTDRDDDQSDDQSTQEGLHAFLLDKGSRIQPVYLLPTRSAWIERMQGKALVSGRLLQAFVASAGGRLARQDGRREPMWS